MAQICIKKTISAGGIVVEYTLVGGPVTLQDSTVLNDGDVLTPAQYAELTTCTTTQKIVPSGETFVGSFVQSPPVNTVKSLTITLESSPDLEISFDGGGSFNLKLSTLGSRTWRGQNGSDLDVSNMRFKGTSASTKYDITYEY